METQLIGFLLDYCPAAAPAFEGDSAVGFLEQSLNKGSERSYGKWKLQYKFLRKLLQLPQSHFQEGSSQQVQYPFSLFTKCSSIENILRE